MTKEQILAMKPGRELDIWIAEKVKGLTLVRCCDKCEPLVNTVTAWDRHEAPHMTADLPGYSTDIVAAWELIESAAKDRHSVSVDYSNVSHRWHAYISGSKRVGQGRYVVENGGYAEATTAPEAICKAALLGVIDCHT